MNRLPLRLREQILTLLMEGASMRATSRITGTSVNTVSKLLADCGDAAADIFDRSVRGVSPQRIECDEIWAFSYTRSRHLSRARSAPEDTGDVWTWTALDPDTKLIVSWMVGDRSSEAAREFMLDVRSRVVGSPQITTDGFAPYEDAVPFAFGRGVDFAQVVKVFSADDPSVTRKVVSGSPDERFISTSLVERQNLTMRMSVRRFTRRTNAHSKRVRNHRRHLAIYFLWYNFCRIHQSLGTTPAVAAGLADSTLSLRGLVEVADGREA